MSLRDDNQRGKSKGKYRDSFDFPFGCAQGQDDGEEVGTIMVFGSGPELRDHARYLRG